EGGLDGVSRPGGAGGKGPDRSQACRAGGGSVGARAHDPAALGSAPKERRNAERGGCHAADQAEDAAQAHSEDGVMLPRLLPMLAMPAAPFDSPEFSFEVKWNGIRALAAVETAAWRLWGRQRADYTMRYPELGVLRRLPVGTLVDGKLVACDADGRPDLPRPLRRPGLTRPWRHCHAQTRCATASGPCPL